MKRGIASLMVFVLLLTEPSGTAAGESGLGFSLTLLCLVSAGLTESADLNVEPYLTMAFMNPEGTRGGLILDAQGKVAAVILADSTGNDDGFLQYVSTQLIPVDNAGIRVQYEAWAGERIRSLNEGVLFAEAFGPYYCCIMMHQSVRACIIADRDQAGDVMNALLQAWQ